MRTPRASGELTRALVAFQSHCPPVAHDKTGQIGSRTYTYASLGQIISTIHVPLAGAGLAITQTSDNGSLVTTLHHVSGGAIESHMPLNLTGLTMQQAGSAITYSKRYALAALLAISTRRMMTAMQRAKLA